MIKLPFGKRRRRLVVTAYFEARMRPNFKYEGPIAKHATEGLGDDVYWRICRQWAANRVRMGAVLG